MRRAPSIDAVRAELRRAIATASVRYGSMPSPHGVDVNDRAWCEIDQAVDAALAAGDAVAADEAVRRWSRHAEHAFGGMA